LEPDASTPNPCATVLNFSVQSLIHLRPWPIETDSPMESDPWACLIQTDFEQLHPVAVPQRIRLPCPAAVWSTFETIGTGPFVQLGTTADPRWATPALSGGAPKLSVMIPNGDGAAHN